MKIHYIRTQREVEDLANTLLRVEPTYIGIDSEGTGLSCHTARMRLLQLAVNDYVYVIDCFKAPNFAKPLSYVIESRPDLIYVGHNLKFDLQFFWKNGLDFSKSKLFDTMLAAKVLESGLPVRFSLDEVAERFLNVELDKSYQKSDWSVENLSKEQIQYAAKDSIIVNALAPILRQRLRDEHAIPVFKLEMRTLLCTAAMEYFGARLDLNELDKLKPIYEERLEKAEDDFLSYVDNRYIKHDFNGNLIDKGLLLSSSAQVIRALRDAGVPNPEEAIDGIEQDELITKSGKKVVKLLDLEKYPIINALLVHRGLSKLLTGYVYKLPHLVNSATGRVHPNFNQCIRTGRFGCSDPNLQNLPRPNPDDPITVRSCFIANPGNKLIDCDYSQIELRVMAEVSGDENMLQEFLDGKDPYAATAAALCGLPYEKFMELPKTEYKAWRQKAKAIRLGYQYSMGAPKFKNVAKTDYNQSFTTEEAKANRRQFFQAYPKLIEYHKSFSNKELREARTLPPFNRKRQWDIYPGTPGLCNHPVQGTSADIQKLAMSLIYEELYKEGYSPVHSHDIMPILTIHDEIVLEAREDLAEHAKELLERCMLQAGRVVLSKCPVKAEAKIIDNLSEKE